MLLGSNMKLSLLIFAVAALLSTLLHGQATANDLEESSTSGNRANQTETVIDDDLRNVTIINLKQKPSNDSSNDEKPSNGSSTDDIVRSKRNHIWSDDVEDSRNETSIDNDRSRNETAESRNSTIRDRNNEKRHAYMNNGGYEEDNFQTYNTNQQQQQQQQQFQAAPVNQYFGEQREQQTGLVYEINEEEAKLRQYERTIPGIPGRDYPILYSVPSTRFQCPGTPGLYGDIESRCQSWHFCQDGGRMDSFLCPNGSLFNQQYLVCDWWYNVECATTRQFYGVNAQYAQLHASRPGFGYNKGHERQRPIGPPITTYRPVAHTTPRPVFSQQPNYEIPQVPRVVVTAASDKAGYGHGSYNTVNQQRGQQGGSSGTYGQGASTGSYGQGVSSGSYGQGSSGTYGQRGSSDTYAQGASSASYGQSALSASQQQQSGTYQQGSSSASYGQSGTAGSYGQSGTSGTYGQAGSSGHSGTSGNYGQSGTSGNYGQSGTSGNYGQSGISGSFGQSGSYGQAGSFRNYGQSGSSAMNEQRVTSGNYGIGRPGSSRNTVLEVASGRYVKSGSAAGSSYGPASPSTAYVKGGSSQVYGGQTGSSAGSGSYPFSGSSGVNRQGSMSTSGQSGSSGNYQQGSVSAGYAIGGSSGTAYEQEAGAYGQRNQGTSSATYSGNQKQVQGGQGYSRGEKSGGNYVAGFNSGQQQSDNQHGYQYSTGSQSGGQRTSTYNQGSRQSTVNRVQQASGPVYPNPTAVSQGVSSGYRYVYSSSKGQVQGSHNGPSVPRVGSNLYPSANRVSGGGNTKTSVSTSANGAYEYSHSSSYPGGSSSVFHASNPRPGTGQKSGYQYPPPGVNVDCGPNRSRCPPGVQTPRRVQQPAEGSYQQTQSDSSYIHNAQNVNTVSTGHGQDLSASGRVEAPSTVAASAIIIDDRLPQNQY